MNSDLREDSDNPKVEDNNDSSEEKKVNKKALSERVYTDFDWPHSQLFVFLGRSGSGKSNFIKFLLYKMFAHPDPAKRWKFGISFVRTKFNHDYDYLPDKYVYEGVLNTDKKKNEDSDMVVKIKKYISNLEEMKRKGKKIPQNFLLFDDMVGLLDGDNSYMNNLWSKFRHTNTNILISVQYCNARKGLNQLLKEQTNNVLAWKTNNQRTYQVVFECWGNGFRNVKEFEQHWNKHTEKDFQAMLIRTYQKEQKKYYSSVMAPDMTKFKNLPPIKFS